MLNEELQVTKKESMDYAPLPKNVYQVELLDINSEEKATYDTRLKPAEEQEMETTLKFQYTLLAGKDKETELRGRNVWVNFIPTYLYVGKKNGKNKLYQITEAFLGRELTQEEEAGGVNGKFLNSLIGKQCRVGVEPTTKGDNTYDTVTGYFVSEEDKEALTQEEKEKATVKPKDDDEPKDYPDKFTSAKEAETEEAIDPADIKF